MGTIYTGHSVSVRSDADGAQVIMGGITQMDVDVGSNVDQEVTAGSPYALNTLLTSQKPKITYSTRDTAKALSLCGLIGKTITGTTNEGLSLWQTQIADGVAMSGSNHRKIRMPYGRLLIRKMSCQNQGDFITDLEAMPLWDTTNQPLIPLGGLALPGTPADPQRHTLYSVTIGSLVFTCLQNIDIDFGVNADMFSCDSDLWDTHLHLSEIKPVISFKTLRLDDFASARVKLTGLVGTHANTTFKFRKRSPSSGTGFVADATAEHISVTTNGLLTIDKAHSSSANKRGEMALKINCAFDGTNVPLIFSTTATL